MSKNQKKYSTAEKRVYIKAFYDSGLSSSMFTRLNGISNSTFQRWIKDPFLNDHFETDDASFPDTEAITAESVSSTFAKIGNDGHYASIVDFSNADNAANEIICDTDKQGTGRSGNTNPMMMHIGMPVRLTCGQIRIDVPMEAKGKDQRCILDALKGIC